jgi:hypothetical protein
MRLVCNERITSQMYWRRAPGRRHGQRHACTNPGPSVPSLFRLTPIDTAKRRKPTPNEIPAQGHRRRHRRRRRKFELYFASSSFAQCALHPLYGSQGGRQAASFGAEVFARQRSPAVGLRR